jgi:hypothetical protein
MAGQRAVAVPAAQLITRAIPQASLGTRAQRSPRRMGAEVSAVTSRSRRSTELLLVLSTEAPVND